jgi:hypothetical protein
MHLLFFDIWIGRQDQVIIPNPQTQILYTSWDWNLVEMYVEVIDI